MNNSMLINSTKTEMKRTNYLKTIHCQNSLNKQGKKKQMKLVCLIHPHISKILSNNM